MHFSHLTLFILLTKYHIFSLWKFKGTSSAHGPVVNKINIYTYIKVFIITKIIIFFKGTGGAGVLGSFSYATLISIGLSPTNTMLIMLIVPIIEGIAFWGILRNPNGIPKQELESQNLQTMCKQDSSITKEEGEEEENFSFNDKIRYMPSLLKYMIPLFLVYFAEYFINQGLVSMQKSSKYKKIKFNKSHFIAFSSHLQLELVYFKNIWIDHASQYRSH